MQDRLKRIKWFSNIQNLCVAESDNMTKTFFMLSSLIFTDEFKNIVTSLERLKKHRVFQISVKTADAEKRINKYGGYLRNKWIIKDDFASLLNAVAGEDVLRSYSTVVVFGGKNCKPQDIDGIHAHFEKNGDVEFAYFDGQQQDCDFIIGAY
jgi:hypothetical protein